jgi:large repetitive protein
MRKPFAVLAATALVAALAAPLANAGSTPKPLAVTVKDNSFTPKSKSIKSNTKVTWTWKGDEDHNVTLVTSGIKGAPKGIKASKYTSRTQDSGTFVRTLKTTGTYFFVCTLHAGMEQTLKVSK